MNLYRYFQAFSLDVAIGACTMSYLVAKAMEIKMPFIVYFSLAMSVWLVYTLDHLFDARQIKKVTVTLRHRLHQTYFKSISWIWLSLFIITCVTSIFYLPAPTLRLGLLIAALVIAYLLMVYLIGERVSMLVQKELGVALAYSVGIFLGPLTLSEHLPIYFWLVFGQIFIYSFINLLEFSYFDYDVDQQQGQISLARIIGKQKLSQLIILLALIGLILQFYAFMFYESYFIYQIILSGIYATLITIFIMKKSFEQHSYYRMLGDFVFLYPAVLFLL